MTWTKLAPGFYETENGYSASLIRGLWMLTYPGQIFAADTYGTLRELKIEAAHHEADSETAGRN